MKDENLVPSILDTDVHMDIWAKPSDPEWAYQMVKAVLDNQDHDKVDTVSIRKPLRIR